MLLCLISSAAHPGSVGSSFNRLRVELHDGLVGHGGRLDTKITRCHFETRENSKGHSSLGHGVKIARYAGISLHGLRVECFTGVWPCEPVFAIGTAELGAEMEDLLDEVRELRLKSLQPHAFIAATAQSAEELGE